MFLSISSIKLVVFFQFHLFFFFIFLDGYGTNKDKTRALSYFQLAAHGGHLHAIFNLGEMNAEGKVVKRNCNFAVEVIVISTIHCTGQQ